MIYIYTPSALSCFSPLGILWAYNLHLARHSALRTCETPDEPLRESMDKALEGRCVDIFGFGQDWNAWKPRDFPELFCFRWNSMIIIVLLLKRKRAPNLSIWWCGVSWFKCIGYYVLFIFHLPHPFWAKESWGVVWRQCFARAFFGDGSIHLDIVFLCDWFKSLCLGMPWYAYIKNKCFNYIPNAGRTFSKQHVFKFVERQPAASTMDANGMLKNLFNLQLTECTPAWIYWWRDKEYIQIIADTSTMFNLTIEIIG